jgi:hypothetical protein
MEDKSYHHGEAELITWEWEDPDLGKIGWGSTLAAEADDLKAKFEGEFGGSEERLYQYWPQAFRWTCCGADGALEWGCDHHGTGLTPCTCDFCKYVLSVVRSRHIPNASAYQNGKVNPG